MSHYGLDIGSRRLALFSLKEGQGWVLRLPRARTGVDDRQDILQRMHDWLRVEGEGGEGILWVDAPYMGGVVKNVKTAMLLAGVVDVARVAWDGPVHPINPSTWKKDVVGDGGAGKPQLREWLESYSPALAEACQGDQDLVDACIVAEYGRRRAAGLVEVRQPVRRRRSRAVLRQRRPKADEPGTGS